MSRRPTTGPRRVRSQGDPIRHPRRRAAQLLLSILVTFVTLRVALHLSPDVDLNVGRYGVHHLFTGLILIVLSGIPLVLGVAEGRLADALTVAFGVGLAMALDEWVYLIVTDGTNASYLLPVSLRGGLVCVALACAYVAVLARRRAAP